MLTRNRIKIAEVRKMAQTVTERLKTDIIQVKNFAQLYKNGLFLFKIYIKMKQIKLNIKESHYTLFVQFLRSLTYVEIETKEKQAVAPSPNYDFSDLSGKLEWKGDAVTQQRAMRDEW